MSPDSARPATLECQLWVLPPDRGHVEQLCAEGRGLLCEEERRRHQAMQNPRAARRFLLGRCLLRRGLAEHLGMRPEELRFTRQAKGKPALRDPEMAGLCFNLSHSGEEAVLAVASCCALGVDLEALSRGPSALRIAERFFSPAERRQIASRPEGAEAAALRLWVLKESVTKALGETVWDALTSVCPDISGPDLDWLRPPPAGNPEDWALMVGPFRKRHVLGLALRAANGWSGKTIRLRSHVLGRGEAEGRLFSPELKSRYPITRQGSC